MMMSDEEQKLKISCKVRCMDSSSVKNAMQGLGAGGIVRVPYTCQLSGNKEEILLLGDSLATGISKVVVEAENAGDAKILAGLLSAELCECDVATLTTMQENDVVRRLRALEMAGVLSHRKIDGMNYYRLASENVRSNIEAVLTEHHQNQGV
jgi:DNA-binding transcriptional ArsR family regulator